MPIAIKNNRPVAGLRLTYGCGLMADHVANYDHNVTRRLRDAGFVIVGTTTLPEYGILPVTEARIFGPTRNPWDLERTPGGSSGGAAAAVAAGMVPVAHGNDGGGSIRIPAACCGLVGLKPARGRVSVAPELGDSSLGIDGVLTRDCRATPPRSSTCSPATSPATPPGRRRRPSRSRRPPPRDPGRLRIAFSKQPPSPAAELDPICARGADEAAELLRSLGHEVIEVDPPWRQEGLSELFGMVFSSQIALSIGYSAAVSGKGVENVSEQDMEPMSWAIFSMVRKLGTLEQQRAVVQLQAFARQLVTWLRQYDALLTPALAERPLAARHARHVCRAPDGDVHPLGPVHAVHAGLQRHRPAGRLAAALPGRGRAAARGADRRARRPARSGCWRSRASSKARTRGRSGAHRSASGCPDGARLG